MPPSQTVCVLKAKPWSDHFAWLYWEAGVRGWQLVKHLQRGLNYWDVFLLEFFLLADLVYLFWALNEAFLNTSLPCVSSPGCSLHV